MTSLISGASCGELKGIAQQIEQDLPQPHGIDGEAAEVLLRFYQQAVLVLLGQLTRGADHVFDQWRELYRLRNEFELAGLDLGEVEHCLPVSRLPLKGRTNFRESSRIPAAETIRV
jgi:hypothetical protein